MNKLNAKRNLLTIVATFTLVAVSFLCDYLDELCSK